jgi:hypothetical protein
MNEMDKTAALLWAQWAEKWSYICGKELKKESDTFRAMSEFLKRIASEK